MANKPGSAVAFRLKGNRKDLSLCHQRECFKVSKTWNLIPTIVDWPRDQFFLVTKSEGQSILVRLFLKAPPTEEQQVAPEEQKPPPTLRLPANVRKRLERNHAQMASDTTHNQMLYSLRTKRDWSTTWIMPVNSKITSLFGAQRIPPGGRAYSHTGLDLRARPGTKVRATSDGVVISTSHQVLSGNVITVDHGQGVVSRYLHLSKFLVKVGDEVKAGQVIGKSGATGRVEAPHLHWEIRIRGYPVDPPTTVALMNQIAQAK